MEPTAVQEVQEVQVDLAQMPSIARARVEAYVSIEELNMRRAMFYAGLIFIVLHLFMHFVPFEDAVKEKIFLNVLVLG